MLSKIGLIRMRKKVAGGRGTQQLLVSQGFGTIVSVEINVSN